MMNENFDMLKSFGGASHQQPSLTGGMIQGNTQENVMPTINDVAMFEGFDELD